MIHNLSNTNRQNHLLYKQSDRCPGCGSAEETFEHVLQCSYEPTSVARTAALDVLRKSLIAISTPPYAIEVVMEGFHDWLQPSLGRSRPSTFGSVRPVDVLLTDAYSHQFNSLGWYQFCLGRISKRWHAAVSACLPPGTSFNSLQWGSLLISALWKFTKTLWIHRNGIVHGEDAEATASRILTGLRDQVRQHYRAFQQDESYVLSRHHYLFTSRTLDQRLNLSFDNVTCSSFPFYVSNPNPSGRGSVMYNAAQSPLLFVSHTHFKYSMFIHSALQS
jgi:hypothetical protein